MNHPSVRIHPESYRHLREYFMDLATKRSAESLAREFRGVPFEPYAPMRRQLLNVLRAVKRKRKAAGVESVSAEALRLSRKGVKPLAGEPAGGGEGARLEA